MTAPDRPGPPAAARRKWSMKRQEVLSDVLADGTARMRAPMYDAGRHLLTVTVTVSDEGAVHVDVHGEPGATLTDLQTWTNIGPEGVS